ncbi:MAG: TraR/DksA family transcriptional regulator [Deltaproteobacteria bacterium]|nr:TraR/DksA family transcriptional regulator [Deltaproteobacteria bacterium]MBI3756329.1 TraR/DksA family transcriptional regulator [Deltaproteobacteria bacterium]
MTDRKKARQERLKKILMDKKRKMWRELREELFNKLGKEYSAQFDNPQDLEDQSLIDVIEDVGLAIADIRRKELTMMDETIRKLEEGTYGICEDCCEEISEERLKIVPFTIYCVKCQKKMEG